jgi:hypothetical protein
MSLPSDMSTVESEAEGEAECQIWMDQQATIK